MIDGINVKINVNEYQALHLIFLFDLKYAHTQRSSETKFKFIGEFRNLIIEIKYSEFNYTLIVRGSLHKYYHDANNSNFVWCELDYVIKDIFSNFEMNMAVFSKKNKATKIKQLTFPLNKVELGVIIEIGIDDLHSFLDINLIQHKKEPFRNEDDLVFTCYHKNYYLKLYPKGQNLIRVEMVFLSIELRKYKIFTLSDLTKDKIRPMAERLKSEMSEIIFADGINIHNIQNLSKAEEVKLLRFTSEWRNKQFTLDNKNAGKRNRKNSAQRMWRLGKVSKQIFESKGIGYKKIFTDLVNQKVDELLSMPTFEII